LFEIGQLSKKEGGKNYVAVKPKCPISKKEVCVFLALEYAEYMILNMKQK
jgi:hypothetical protein